MLNPQHLAIFSTIVQAGSISAAAQQLGCGKSVVSRQLARLESDLGARLIQRSTRRLALTEIGEIVLQQARAIEQSLSNIEQLTDQHQQQVRGLLKISCSMAGRRQMVPLIAEFTRLYPEVTISLRLEDQLVDLIADHIDLAIRASPLADSSLVARKLADNPRVLAAAPAYLLEAGTPENPAQLSSHACLIYENAGRTYDEWTFMNPDGNYKVRVSGPIHSNDGSALVNAAVCGAGIVLIPEKVISEELERGELVRVLAPFQLPAGSPIYAVYPARDWLPLKTSTFVDFLQRKMKE